MTTGSRSTIAGVMKLERSGRSTTLTGRPAASAARATSASTAGRPVAAMTRAWPSTSPGRKRLRRREMRPASARSEISSVLCGLTAVTLASAFNKSLSLRAAVSPPPTSKAGRSVRFMKAG